MTKTLPAAELQQLLKEWLRYDPESGELYWRRTAGSNARLGQVAGHLDINSGYVRLGFQGVTYRVNILVWIYMTGTYPVGIIDHEDRNKANNRWTNLRDVTKSVNTINVGIKANNTSGCTGVYYNKKTASWEARNTAGKSLGMFATFDLAKAKRLESLK